MLPAVAILAMLAPLVITAPTAPEDLTVVWRHNKRSSQKHISVYDADGRKLLGQTCGDAVDAGNFALAPLPLECDENGHGSLKYGSEKYKTHSMREHSGGITCDKIYNDDVAHVECKVPSQGSHYTPLGKNETNNCFAEHPIEHHFRLHKQASEVPVERSIPLEKRFGPVCVPPRVRLVERVGDGNPHQNSWHEQLTENMVCGSADECSTSEEKSHDVSVEWSVGLQGMESWGWISGGFAVSESWSTSITNTCTGGDTADLVCLWYNTQHTAYTVKTRHRACGEPKIKETEPYVIKSPNKNNIGGGYYCVTGGACRNIGAHYWNNNGRAGGP